MSTLIEQIERARARARELDIDLRTLAGRARQAAPAELAPERQRALRHDFLAERLGDAANATRQLERILQGNELQDVNYLARGVRAARAVARVAIASPSGRAVGWGTGFLVAPGVLITNNHVLPDAATAARSVAEFGFERDIDGQDQDGHPFSFEPDRLYLTSEVLDFTVVAVAPRSLDGATPGDGFGWLPLVGTVGKVMEGEWLTIVQHPGGEPKQVCVRENQLLRIAQDVLWYSTDTLGGSSGSPVFNNDWTVVALHHAGVPETRDGRIRTVDDRDFDPARDDESRIRWVANEGIRVSRIVDELGRQAPGHPLLQAVFTAQPSTARGVTVPVAAPAPASPVAGGGAGSVSMPRSAPAADAGPDTGGGERRLVLTLGLAADGRVRLVDGRAAPLPARDGGADGVAADEDTTTDLPFDPDYAARRGFDPSFLGRRLAWRVGLPRLGATPAAAAARLLAPVRGNDRVLHYHRYSLVMHAARRLALYSAANVDLGARFAMRRPADRWLLDPRIAPEAQLTEFYYRDNQFDRGHLTRREDLEYGATRMEALQAAADTCHWTNCAPQHASFNQNRQLWQGLERHLLEDSIARGVLRAQVITGPVLADDDPVWDRFPRIRYPVRFWKVVAAPDLHGRLFATAYLLDQSPVVAQFGIEAGGEPFGAFKTYQLPIAEVERLTGLAFWSGTATSPVPLAAADPLSDPALRQRLRPRPRPEEAGGPQLPEGWLPLDRLDQVVVRP